MTKAFAQVIMIGVGSFTQPMHSFFEEDFIFNQNHITNDCELAFPIRSAEELGMLVGLTTDPGRLSDTVRVFIKKTISSAVSGKSHPESESNLVLCKVCRARPPTHI